MVSLNNTTQKHKSPKIGTYPGCTIQYNMNIEETYYKIWQDTLSYRNL